MSSKMNVEVRESGTKQDTGAKCDILDFINNISETTALNIVNFGQYFAHTLVTYVHNRRLRNPHYNTHKKAKIKVSRYGQFSETSG